MVMACKEEKDYWSKYFATVLPEQKVFKLLECFICHRMKFYCDSWQRLGGVIVVLAVSVSEELVKCDSHF